MKTFAINTCLVLLCFAATQCGQKSHEHDMHQHESADSSQGGENKVLYDAVMDVHNEVMPEMDNIYKLKQALSDKIAKSPGLPEQKKQEIERTIVKLDSASEGMMIWMRQFSPLPDTDKAAAKQYLEKEMIKVKKVKEDIIQALEEGNALK